MSKNRALAAALIAAVAFAVAFHGFAEIKYVADPLQAAQRLLTSLIVITVFIERSTAIFDSIWYGDERRANEFNFDLKAQRLAAARANVAQLHAGLALLLQQPAAAGQEQARAAALGALQQQHQVAENELQAAHDDLTETEAKAMRLRLVLGFVFALLVSAVGVRTLASLVDASQLGSTNQLGLFHGVDIVVTAGLIAGGTNGISAIAGVLAKFLQKTQLNLAASPSPTGTAQLDGRVRALELQQAAQAPLLTETHAKVTGLQATADAIQQSVDRAAGATKTG